jgi:hypothetical protein
MGSAQLVEVHLDRACMCAVRQGYLHSLLTPGYVGSDLLPVDKLRVRCCRHACLQAQTPLTSALPDNATRTTQVVIIACTHQDTFLNAQSY